MFPLPQANSPCCLKKGKKHNAARDHSYNSAHLLTRKKMEKEEEEKEERRYSNTRGLGRKGAGSKDGSQTSRVPLLMPSTTGPRACL